MDVILLERIEKLGKLGDVVKVKPGYARNFLLPQGKALRATDENRSRFEKQRADLERNSAQARDQAESVGGKVAGAVLPIIRQAGESGQLYGSVSARDISEAIAGLGVQVDRRQVRLDHPIKMLGLHPVRIALHPELIVTVTANVAMSPEDAETQLQRGTAVTRAALETGPEEAGEEAQGAEA